MNALTPTEGQSHVRLGIDFRQSDSEAEIIR